MSQVIGDLTDNNNEVGAISHERLAHIINAEAELGTASRRHLFRCEHHLTVDDTLCHHLYVLPILLRIAPIASLEEVPGILKDHEAVLYGLCPDMLTAVHRQANAITVAENRHVLLRELRHFVGYRNDGLFGLLQQRCSKHCRSSLRLAEGIIDTTPIGVWVVATLVVERMPLTAADELARRMEQLLRRVIEAQGLRQHGTLAPRA